VKISKGWTCVSECVKTYAGELERVTMHLRCV